MGMLLLPESSAPDWAIFGPIWSADDSGGGEKPTASPPKPSAARSGPKWA
eukprot:NODE_2526_length_1096_cov_13.001910_g2099_i0.p8 GENE.NODE_2526_length_1096_cov_13.001910_g2099_i0~~NODE_2526_length_1096_cov_13.001910_g2099_i0.p8  ORF type:complete len:50 (-),score=2.39 NODE_2526_length_1096_cov_13.001910_g2099_i0:149-298(-)